MGFVDLHCHLLPAVDDGCESADEALEAARLLASLGFDAIAPSPHVDADYPAGDAALCEQRRAELQALLDREGIAVRLHANAENRLDEGFLARAGGDGRRGIGGTRWALVEVPFRGGVPTLPDLVFRLRRLGVLPLFAHPERCQAFERTGVAEEVVRLGGALQLNVGALVAAYGRPARVVAERLLDAGLYAVAATDLHQPLGAEEWLPDALEALERRAGAALHRRLLDENPRRILAGGELP